MTRIKRSDKGSILISAFWIIAILAFLAVGIGFRASLEVRLSRYNLDRLTALHLAWAGVVKARARLEKSEREFDSITECGIALDAGKHETAEGIFRGDANRTKEGVFSVYYMVPCEEGGAWRKIYGMADEERRIDIKAHPELPHYDKILERLLGRFSDNAAEIMTALSKWRSNPNSGGDPGGFGIEDYASKGYDAKNAEFETTEEMELVEGMTPELWENIKGYVTAYSDGKININTAPREVLIAALGGEAYEALADEILSRRNGEDKLPFTGDDNFFTNWDDVERVAGNDSGENIAWRAAIDIFRDYYGTLKSANFRIVSHGMSRGVPRTIRAVVREGAGGGNKLLYFHEDL